MILKATIQEDAIAKEILKLQKRAYKVEAELIGFNGIPPLHETLEQLQQSNEVFFVYMEGEVISGAIAIEYNHTCIHISRVMVDPSSFRKGIARTLLTHVEEQTEEGVPLLVSTGSRNFPAIRLYTSMGYERIGTKDIEEGLSLVLLRKQ
ncbi:GNAT family N-acetyltransferase [Bacillus sp. JCM 19041]|uniref:GNAT family N-acetyltransferase n=1 Tax=Bacillus sp. JCM 19041 TaxID=1460637 RepID=UPI0006D0A5DA